MVSGGSDSMALLCLVHAFNERTARRVIVHHCDHGVHPDSEQWASLVEKAATKRAWESHVHRLSLTPGADFEARARAARYSAILPFVGPLDVVMTGHHQDDQVETLCLRLAQGTGLIGLTGIPVARPFGLGRLVRPFLDLTRAQLRHECTLRNEAFVEDSSNLDIRYHRNLARLHLIPRLARIAPLARSQLLALRRVAIADVERMRARLAPCVPDRETLIVPMADHAEGICWQIRFWCHAHGWYAPSSAMLDEFARQCLTADSDRQPEILIHEQIAIRAWGRRLWWVERATARPDERVERVRLEPNQPVSLHFHGGTLHLDPGPIGEQLTIYQGVTGRSFRLARNRPQYSLKQLAQSLSVPPWQRGLWPLIASKDLVLGWGPIDARESHLIPHPLTWTWSPEPRKSDGSAVS